MPLYRQSLVVSVTLVVLLLGANTAWAQRAMTLVDLINVPRLSAPQLSPDGRLVVYEQSEADWKMNRRVDQIWRAGADGSDPRQLTHGPEGAQRPLWAPDGRAITFLARRGEKSETQIHLLPVDGGEARALTTHPTSVSNLAWSPDGAAIYFLAPDPKTPEEIAREEAGDDVFAVDENFKPQHLWKVTVADGRTQRITEGAFSVTEYTVSSDGRKIAFHRGPSPLYGDADQAEVWVMDTTDHTAVQLTRNAVPESGAALSPDNSQVLFLSQANAAFDFYYNQNIFVMPASGGPVRLLTGDLPYEVNAAAWAKDGRSIYFVANMGVHSQLFQLDVTGGAPRQLTSGDHTLASWTLAGPAARHVFILDQPTNPGEVWTLGLDAGAKPQRVTRVLDGVARDYRLPRQERIEYTGADGVRVEALLFYPLDYRDGQRYPLVVQTHGGPAASDKFGFGRWGSYVQVLTAKGYAVLQPNYRGSTGYGDDFLRDMVGSYFKNSHVDVMRGVDHLIGRGVADPDRLVKMGWSAGGHMTNKIITFTDRFKAASSGAGASNWTSMYGQSDVRTYRTPWFGGTPWQKDAPIDVYWEHSPLKYVANVTTPTIFIVGEKDVRVPPEQSVEMFRALRSLGVPTHLYIAPRQPHGFQELRHQLFKMNVELEWFERHAMGRSYVWEKAPVDPAPAPPTTSSGGAPGGQ
jgi:dipeptidyl aminopeptidase/acylaminoacyl peptidase